MDYSQKLTNIIGAFAEPNLLGVIFTAIVFGIALLKLRESDSHREAGARVYEVVSGWRHRW